MPYDIRKERLILAVPEYERNYALDIGCGECLYYKFFKKYIGVDINPRCPPNVKVVKADFHSLPFPDNTFDVILLFDVLEHTKNYGLLLDEAVRVAKPGAWILGSTIWITGDAVHRDTEHRHCYTEELLRRVLEDYGIKAKIFRSIDILLFIGRLP